MFDYPTIIRSRKHGPIGYLRYGSYKSWLRDEFSFRCVYCLMREQWYPNGQDSFSVDHFVPQSVDQTLALQYDNLLYACHTCNSIRQDRDILDPVAFAYGHHIQLSLDGKIQPLTPAGKALIKVFVLNRTSRIKARLKIMQTIQALQESNTLETVEMLNQWPGFPDDLPDLSNFRPPAGNTRPAGAEACFYEQRKHGILPNRY